MAHAEICPICQGSGRIIIDGEHCTVPISNPCHGCNGSGWVTVADIVGDLDIYSWAITSEHVVNPTAVDRAGITEIADNDTLVVKCTLRKY